jgi:hypothetical protein
MATTGKIIALMLLFLAVSTGAGIAGDKIRAGLYLAENEPPPPGAALARPQLNYQLQQVFGFVHYRQLKEQYFSLHNEWAQWFIPRRDFFVRIEPLHHEPGQPRMIDYEIYKDGFIVVKGTYEVHEETPLFINGPDFRSGRLILVIEAR